MNGNTNVPGIVNSLEYKISDAFVRKWLPIGSIIMWSGNTAPEGWGLCNGSTYTKTDGSGTIIAPDLRGRFVLSLGQGPLDFSNSTVGATGGEQNHTLTINEMPSHSHTNNSTGSSLGLAQTTGFNTLTSSDTSGGELDLVNAASLTINNTGGGQPHNNMPPFYVLAYIIKI